MQQSLIDIVGSFVKRTHHDRSGVSKISLYESSSFSGQIDPFQLQGEPLSEEGPVVQLVHHAGF